MKDAMTNTEAYRTAKKATGRRLRRAGGFSLIELLTVMFIISLLIALLFPSLNAARNVAKKTATAASISSLGTALDLFRNDNERSFSQTNGYPPSFAHPRMVKSDGDDIFKTYLGECPFLNENEHPVISGAHWLPAMLMGFDQLGYVKRSTVPKKKDLREKPWEWYTPDPLDTGQALVRAGFYADPGGVKTALTGRLPGVPNEELYDAGAWEYLRQLPVLIDNFGQPILYYAANANGRTTNLVEEERDRLNVYQGPGEESGPPFYFHQDNQLFTGNKEQVGWDFDGAHPIAYAGDEFTAEQLSDEENADAQRSFARFILDRALYRSLELKQEETEAIPKTTPLRPVNADSYMLISAGVDGRYGTNDDVTNFPLTIEE